MHLTQQTLGATGLQLLNYPHLDIEEAHGVIIIMSYKYKHTQYSNL